MEKWILVTGCAGFIGSGVAKKFLDQGLLVCGIDNLNNYYDVRLKNHRLESLKGNANFKFIELDIEDRQGVEKVFATHQFDGVVNLAARAGVRSSMETPHVYYTTNVMGTLNLLESMRKHQVKKFILASTSSLYAGQPMPFSEELMVNTPISPYAASKKGAEVTTYTYSHQFKIDSTVLRFFTVYGPAGRPDMSVFRFVKWVDEGTPLTVYGSGEQKRDFTFIDDIVEGVFLAYQKLNGFQVINLGGGKSPTSVNELIALIANRLGKEPKVNHLDFHCADVMETYADISKAKKELGWVPKTSVEHGVELSVRWYLDNRDLVKAIQV